MGKNIVRITSNKNEAQREANRINKSLKERGIKREAYVDTISKTYVQVRTRPGYAVRNKNYTICMRNNQTTKNTHLRQ